MAIRLVYSIMWKCVYLCSRKQFVASFHGEHRVEVSSSFSSHLGGVLTTTSGVHRGVGYSVASFPGPPSSGALPTPQGNSLSVPGTVMICGCVVCGLLCHSICC